LFIFQLNVPINIVFGDLNRMKSSIMSKVTCWLKSVFFSWIQGPNHAAVTACATGAHSIGDAARMIQFGDSNVMLAGGTESSIDALSIAGFCR
jgi:3-oxoacyl-(acyl-carrier-protein) synthase